MTRLQAENPNLHAAQLQALGGAVTSPEQLWAEMRAVAYAALRLAGVPELFAAPLADRAVAETRELALPHIVAGVVDAGEGITIEGR